MVAELCMCCVCVCRGVFATHLHLLVDLLAGIPSITDYKMEVVAKAAADETEAEAAGGSVGGRATSPVEYACLCTHLGAAW